MNLLACTFFLEAYLVLDLLVRNAKDIFFLIEAIDFGNPQLLNEKLIPALLLVFLLENGKTI